MLHLHRSERADGLVAMLGELLAVPLADPFTPEVIAVPTRGIERWLSQQLSGLLGVTPGRADGACANVEFPFPWALVGGAVAGASGLDHGTDPWAPERAVWPLLDLVEECSTERWLAPLTAHLQNAAPEGEGRRFAAVRHIADLYDRYGVHRPEMLHAWAAGKDGLPSESRWQAELWRRLRGHLDIPSPAERLGEACANLRGDPALVELPARIALFGMTRLPGSYLDVLAALAHGRDVHLFLLHPSPSLWEAIAASLPSPPRGLRRRDDPTAEATRSPLLGSWGQDAREMQLVLASVTAERVDHHRPIAAAPPTLLGRLQIDVREDRRPPGAPAPGDTDRRMALDPSDDSLRIHSCHGRARQVEVLRDAVLHLFETYPDLEPRDVVVMCPDIETYAPLIHATFGAHEPDGDGAGTGAFAAAGGGGGGPGGGGPGGSGHPSDLRVRLADRSLRQTNPVLGVVTQLLELATARVTASQVLDFAGREPVRRRFRLDHDDLTRLEEWVGSAGIRWGLDASHREPFKLGALEANSWRAGLDRTLLGVTMADEGERRFGEVVPLDDVDSGDIDLVGRFVELVDRLHSAVDALSATQPVTVWAGAIAGAAADLTATSDSESWQLAQLGHLLDEVVDEATTDGTASTAVLSPADMGAHLADRLRGRPTRANFRTGHLTICTLVPMRSVPHRVVCLLGLDDGAFPRHTQRDGDDLILADPHVGDRDSRSEDRQLLLDALLAATDHLVITYTGRDERTNLPRPPSVPLGELLDIVDRTASAAGRPARDEVVLPHPLQPFDTRNFTVGGIVRGRPWSFDDVNLAGARALQSPREARPAFLAGPLLPLDTATVELDQLERFVRHPVGAFLRQRLGIYLRYGSGDIADGLPVALDALAQWAIGDRLLTARLAGADREACVAAERARGQLPPGALGEPVLEEIAASVDGLVAAAADPQDATSLDVHLTLPDGTIIVGTVAGVRGRLLHHVTYSRLGPTQRLHAWLRLLALSASRPDQAFEALTIGRGRGASNKIRVSTSRIAPLGHDAASRRTDAVAYLEVILDLFRRGMREPVPLYCRTSAAWAEAVRDAEGDPVTSASSQWKSDYRIPKEDKDPEHRLVLGKVIELEEVLSESPLDDESGGRWAMDETSRFGRYACRLWDGLLDHEKLVHE